MDILLCASISFSVELNHYNVLFNMTVYLKITIFIIILGKSWKGKIGGSVNKLLNLVLGDLSKLYVDTLNSFWEIN